MYLKIKRTVRTERDYVLETNLPPKMLQNGIRSGKYNIVPHFTREDTLWVVDEAGVKVATLIDEGGLGPDETVDVSIFGAENEKEKAKS